MESHKEDVERKINSQVKGEVLGPNPIQNVKKDFHQELEIAMDLAMQDDEGNAQEFEQPHFTLGNENMDTTAELELYVHQCQERIQEFDKELKQRDSTITQLEETLNGILSIVKKAHEEGRLAEDYVEVLKTRVSSASKSLPSVYQVKYEDDDIISEEQDRSLTEISESPALHPFPDRSRKNIENGENEAYYKQCSHQCKHLEEINQIKEQVLESLEFLQVPADVFLKHHELGLSDNIGYLSSQAHMYKCASEEAVVQLQSTKEKSESIKSEVISKKEEICKLNAQIKDLTSELKLMKDRCNKLQQDSIGSPGLSMQLNEHQPKSSVENKHTQSNINLNMMDKLIDILTSDSSKFTDMKDILSDMNLMRNDDEKNFMVLVNMNCPLSNEAVVQAKCVKDGETENLTHGASTNLSGSENRVMPPDSSPPMSSSKLTKNVCNNNEVKVNLKNPDICVSITEDMGKEIEKKNSSCELSEMGFGASIINNTKVEELLLDLGAKAREGSIIKRQLKIMEEREMSLRNQLSSSMDICDKAEKRCKNAENLAMNLQNDLEILLCERRAFEVNKSELTASGLQSNEKGMAFINSSHNTAVNADGQWTGSLKDIDGKSMEMEEDFIPSFLSKLWEKVQSEFDAIVKMTEENIDSLFPKKIAQLRASLESGISQIALYLKRKNEMLIQAKMSLEAISHFQELKIQVAESFNLGNLKSPPLLEGKEHDICGLETIDNCATEDILSSVKHAHMEMESINSKLIRCLMHCIEQEYEKLTTELKVNHANDVASLKQLHTLQLKKLKKEVTEKIVETQEKTEEMIMSKPSLCWEVKPGDIEIKDCYREELEAVWSEVDEKHKEALKEIYQKIFAEKVSLATELYKESYDLKVSQEINLLKVVHEQEMEDLKSTLEHQKLLEELNIRQGIGEEWLKKLEEEANTVKENDPEVPPMTVESVEPFDMSRDQDCQPHPQHTFVNLQALLVLKSDDHIKEMAQRQFKCLKEVMERLHSEQTQFKMKLMEMYSNCMSSIVPTDVNGKPMEYKSESYSMNQNICSLMGAGDDAWINDIKTLKKDLEAKHAKEMESLRLYFEKKCAEVEKRYAEDVLTQRSKKCSHTGCSDGSSNTSIVGSEAELESDHFYLNPEDVDSSRNLEIEYERVSMDMQLMVGQEMSYDDRRVNHHVIELEAKIREELRLQFAQDNEKRLAELIKELESKHEKELKAQIDAEAKAYSRHIEEVTSAIKKCSEEEQEKFITSHREMMDKFLEQHQKDLIDLNELHDKELQAFQLRDNSSEIEELKAEIERMHIKYKEELLLASQRLTQEHAKEVSELKESLIIQHKEEIDRLVHDIKKKEENCEELKRHYEAKLEEIKENFDAKLQERVEQARHTITKNLDGQIQALLAEGIGKDAANSTELSNLREHLALEDSKLAAIKDGVNGQREPKTDHHLAEAKKLMSDHSELSNPVLLEQRVDLLKHGIESDFNDRFSRSECMGRDLLTLKLQVNQLEQSKNILLSRFGGDEMEIDDATSITILHTDLDKLLKDRDKWKKFTQILGLLFKDLFDYTQRCEDELNDTIVQSVLRLSGISETSGSLDESVNGVCQPRRVHIAPERLPNILNVDEIDNGDQGESVISQLEESGEEIRVELRQCLARLRAEASALLGLSTCFRAADENITFNNNIESQQDLIDKISLLEDHLKMETSEKDRLKVELHTAKGLCEGHASTIASLQARVAQAEAQMTAMLMKKAEAQRRLETVAEGFGEANDVTHFSGQLQRIAKLGEKARMVLKEYQHQGDNASTGQAGLSGTLIAQLVEELCVEGDRLSEEARKEREDLQLQVEAADKQLRSTRAFLEEQAVEREQEREEFQRELHCLQEALEGREREKMDRERIAKEEIQRLHQKEGQDTDPSSRATVESLEQHSKDLAQLLQETSTKKAELEVELKAAVDKIWDLREIIRELEGQVEGSLLLERDLRAKNEMLAGDMALQSKKLNDLIEELESLRSSLGYNIPGELETEGHTALLEKALRKHCLQVEQAKSLGPSLKDLTYKLLDMGQLIDKKTKEIEAVQVTPAGCGNCSSPSEDVSIREQLEQVTWRSESPLEDEVSEQGGGSEEALGSSKNPSSHPIPRVPLAEFTSLQEKFSRHCQAQEPMLKKIHDLEMQLHSLRRNEEELITEREVLQSQVEQQLLHTSELQARLDEARQRGGRQVHCMTMTPLPSSPLTRSPIGSPSATPDQPFFCCAALADARHEIEKINECLEKKELEVTQLKGALENSKKVVASQEKELISKAQEEAQTLKNLRELESLKSEKDALQIKLSQRIKTDGEKVPFSMLLDALLSEKNEEIDFLSLQLTNLKEQLVKANEEYSVLSQKVVQLSKKSVEDNEPNLQHLNTNDSSLGPEIEALRDCTATEMSIGGAGMIHPKELHKWFHSTKLEIQNLTDSPGLTASPVTPYIREAQAVVNTPILEGESQKNLDSLPLSSTGCSKSKAEGTLSTLVQDAEVQTSGHMEIDDLKVLLSDKEKEIKELTVKVDELLGEKNDLSSLIEELREKVAWHSHHLEVLEKESLGWESLINGIKAEKESLQTTLLKSEQEVEKLKTSHSALQEEIVKQEEHIKLLNGRIDKYGWANKDQHMLLKAAQQERMEVISVIEALSIECQHETDHHEPSPTSNSSEKYNSSDGKDSDASQRKLHSPVGENTSLRDKVIKLVEEIKYLRTEMNNLTSQRDKINQELTKALEVQESLKSKINVDSNSEALEPFSDADERGSSPLEHESLEKMIEKVQKEGIEVLSLSEIAASRKSASGNGTPTSTATPLGSPICVDEDDQGDSSMSSTPQKKKQELLAEEERGRLLQIIQSLQRELASKEREETRNRDWMEFQEKEGHAGWAGVVDVVGQKQRHELEILGRLGEQRNERARLEAEVCELKQLVNQAQAETQKTIYRLGIERSHVIRLQSVLQQEKSNFSQLQLSLEIERKRSSMTKEMNARVNKALEGELTQYHAKFLQLQESLKEEHDMKSKLEARLNQLKMELGYAVGSNEEQRMKLEMMMSGEHLKLKEIEANCERKALEQELEAEKQRRIKSQQEVAHLRSILEARPNQDFNISVECSRWNSASLPSTPNVSDSSFNAEEVLQNLQGINQVLGWHVRNNDEYQNPNPVPLERENNFLKAKCSHLEQKLVALQDMLTRERSMWANERAMLLRDRQYLFQMNESISHHTTPKEIQKFHEVFQRVYAHYWRSERNRKALSWQKRYFLSLLEDYKVFKHQTIDELSKVTGEQRSIIETMTGRSCTHSGFSVEASCQKSRGNKSFRVVVWSVIATLKMKVLVLRSMTGIRIGSQSLLEGIMQPAHSFTIVHHPQCLPQTHLNLPCSSGTSNGGSQYTMNSLPSAVGVRKKNPAEEKYQHSP